MLVGAYQEVMGNNHNLFGAPHEAHIHIDEEGYLIKKVIRGTTVGEAAGARALRAQPAARRLSPADQSARQGRRIERSRRRRAGPVLRIALRRLHLSCQLMAVEDRGRDVRPIINQNRTTSLLVEFISEALIEVRREVDNLMVTQRKPKAIEVSDYSDAAGSGGPRSFGGRTAGEDGRRRLWRPPAGRSPPHLARHARRQHDHHGRRLRAR